MKRLLTVIGAVALVTAMAPRAMANTITYTIQDVGTFSGYTDSNLGDTFTGTGFVGIYTPFPNDFGVSGPSFAHLFGLENYNGIASETEMQVNVSALAGATINSATLSYQLLDASSGSQSVTATAYTTTGTLAYNDVPPDTLASTVFTSSGSSNSADVTSLLQANQLLGNSWFGLYLTPNGPGHNYQWTYTYSGYGDGPDRADVRLTVNYSPVPEPEPLLLLGTGLLLLLGSAWRTGRVGLFHRV